MRWGDRTLVRVGRTSAAVASVSAAAGSIWLALLAPVRIVEDLVLSQTVIGVGFGLMTWVVIPRQPRNRAVWVASVAALGAGLFCLLEAVFYQQLVWIGIDPATPGLRPTDLPRYVAITFQMTSIAVVGLLPFTVGLLLFPDGHLPSPRWQWVGWMAVASLATVGIAFAWFGRPSSTTPYDTVAAESAPLTQLGPVMAVAAWSVLFSMITSGAGMLVQFLRSRGAERQQFRWVVWGASVAIAVTVLAMLTLVFTDIESIPFLLEIPFAILVLSYGFAIARYRLYDVDVVISRTVLYGTMAGFIGLVYVLVVVVVGGLIGADSGSLFLPILATGVVALAFEPVRVKAQRWANRLVYGQRTSPYDVLSELTTRLGGTEPTPRVLTRMAQLMASGTGAERATVWLARGEGFTSAATWPQGLQAEKVDSADRLEGTVAPVTHDGELVGALQVVTSRGYPVTPGERHLLDDLAGSAGMVLGNQRLNASLEARADELRVSRRRLVQVQDQERRRLERDLHDGAQQQVVALKVKLSLAERLARQRDSERLANRLAGIGAHVQEVLEQVRTIARGIYPPLLESEGIEAVLRSYAATAPVPVELDLRAAHRYGRDVESAVYFAVLEAVGQAARDEMSRRIRVSVQDDTDTLALEVTAPDGGWMTGNSPLIGVRDRIEALGGTFTVAPERSSMSARIPLESGGGPVNERWEAEFVTAGSG